MRFDWPNDSLGETGRMIRKIICRSSPKSEDEGVLCNLSPCLAAGAERGHE